MSKAGTARILVVDDDPRNVRWLRDLLGLEGYVTEGGVDGLSALDAVDRFAPDVVLLDVRMPGMSGLEVCERLRADPRYEALPVVLVTASDVDDRVRGLQAGADDFLVKPVDRAELLARVRSLARTKQLLDENRAYARELESRVAVKVKEIERLSRYKRFLDPRIVRRIEAGDCADPLLSHRQDIAVVFFDLRGFTAFSEGAAPEDVVSLLREFHRAIGLLSRESGGTIERYAGDGVMVFFNDPEPVPEPCAVAVRFARAVVEVCETFLSRRRREGFSIDVSAGVAYGYATLGEIGFEDRIDYGAIGGVTNLAARLCAEARPGEVLVSARVAAYLPADLALVPAGPFTLKGFRDPMQAYALRAVGDGMRASQ